MIIQENVTQAAVSQKDEYDGDDQAYDSTRISATIE